MSANNLFGNNGLLSGLGSLGDSSLQSQLLRVISDGGSARGFMNSGSPAPAARDWKPNLDVYEGPDSYVMYLELAGMDQSSVRINNEAQVLKISGNRSVNDGACFTRKRSELSLGQFERTFRLPPDSDQTRIDATMEHGMLKMVVPKIRFTLESNTISINAHITDAEADSVVENLD